MMQRIWAKRGELGMSGPHWDRASHQHPAGDCQLLQGSVEVVFAGADALRQGRDEVGGHLLAMGANQRRQRREQRGMRERLGLDAILLGGIPGFRQIFERDLTLFGVALGKPLDSRLGEYRIVSAHAWWPTMIAAR